MHLTYIGILIVSRYIALGQKRDRTLEVLETLATRGRVSGYELKNILSISLSNAQWWLSHLEKTGLARIYEKEPVRRQRIFYGLTMIGFLLALKRAKVRANFASIFVRSLQFQDDKTIDPKLKENLFEALKSSDTSEKFKQFYIAISDALDDLTDIYSIDDDKLLDLATYYAGLKEPEKMRTILGDLYSKVLLIQRVVDVCRLYGCQLDKIVKGEM